MTRQPPRRARRWIVLIGLALAVLLGAAAPASAASTTATASPSLAATMRTPAAPAEEEAEAEAEAEAPKRDCEVGPLDVKGSNGLCADRYRSLSLDRGDAWTAPKMADAWFYDKIWDTYLSGFMGNIEILNWTYGFTWVDSISEAITPVAKNLSNLIERFGVVPFAMSISGFIYGIAWFRGNRSKALTGIMLLCTVAAIAVFFASPNKYFFGSEGFFAKSKAVGNELVTAATSGAGDTTGMYQPDTGALPANEVLLKSSVGPTMVDALLDDPYQVISFGKKLEGSCKATFTEAMKDPQAIKSGNNFVRDKVAGCDPAAKTFIESPTTRFGSMIGVFVMGFGYEAMVYTLVGILLLCVVFAAYQLVLAVWHCFKAMFPWTDTTEVFSTVVKALLYLGFVAVSGLILAIVLVIVTNFMGMFSTMPEVKYQIIGGLFVIGVVLLVVMWRRLLRAGKNIGDRLRRAMQSNANNSTPATPKLVTRGIRAVSGLGSHAVSSAIGNRWGNGKRRTNAADSIEQPPQTNPTSGGPTSTSQNEDTSSETAPAPQTNPRTDSMRQRLLTVAKRTPAGAVAVSAAGKVATGGKTVGNVGKAGAHGAKVAAVHVQEQWAKNADPEKRRSAHNKELRERLAGKDAKAAHAAQVKEYKRQSKEHSTAAKSHKRQLRRDVETERANAPLFNEQHEQRQRQAAQRRQQMPLGQRRVEKLRAKLEESQFQEQRLQQARERAEEKNGPAPTAPVKPVRAQEPKPEPVKKP